MQNRALDSVCFIDSTVYVPSYFMAVGKRKIVCLLRTDRPGGGVVLTSLRWGRVQLRWTCDYGINWPPPVRPAHRFFTRFRIREWCGIVLLQDSGVGTPVTLRIDTNGFYLFWVDQNHEMDMLDIATIRDSRTGKYAKIPKVLRIKGHAVKYHGN